MLVAFDIETTITQLYKRKGTPFYGKNWVVAAACGTADEDGKTLKLLQVDYYGGTPPQDGWLADFIKPGTTDLAGVNIKFDILHAIQTPKNYEIWRNYIVRGGRIWDCQLAEYLLQGMTSEFHMMSLDRLSALYGGDQKIDEVKLLWANGVNTHLIDRDLLMRYLIGYEDNGKRVEGDIGNTLNVALKQVALATDRGQMASIRLNMASLVCSIEIEHRGLFVDKAEGIKMAEDLKKSIEDLQSSLTTYLPPNLPLEFNWGSRYHKSALIFGGSTEYTTKHYLLNDGRVVDQDAYYSEALDNQACETDDGVEFYLVDGTFTTVEPNDANSHLYTKYKSGKNEGLYKTRKVKIPDIGRPKRRNVTLTYTFPGFTTPKDEWKSSTPGVYSVNADVIEALATRGIPFIKTLKTMSDTQKDLGTYFITTDDNGETKGMLTLVDDGDNIIHHSINHTSTVTGRFSSSSPNLQNLPKGKKSKVKQLFRSRFPGGKIIQSDFTALEIYVQAILSNCKNLIQDLKDGLDMHCLRLANKEGMDYKEVLELCKGENATKEWDDKRTDAKAYSFQAAYGAGDQKISDSTGMPIEVVQAFRAADDERYPELNGYFDDCVAQIALNRTDTGKTVKHPTLNVLCSIHKSFLRTPDGKIYTYLETPSPDYLAAKGKLSSFSPTEIKNYSVQGTGAEFAKAAMALAIMLFYKLNNFNGRAFIINQVHDALYVDAHPDVAVQAAALLHACMVCASAYMESLFKWKLPIYVPSDTTWGNSMADDDKITDPTYKIACDKYVKIITNNLKGEKQ